MKVFTTFCSMASNHLAHLSLASTHRASIAFCLLILTIFVVPFLSFSITELLPHALPGIAFTLWDSLLGILTSSPFYFFLLNFLIAALIFSSGVLDSSSPGREFDGLQDGDLHQRGLHNYSTAAQIFNERLALDDLYESQAYSSPNLSITESARIYVADDRMIGHGYGDESKGQNYKGKQVMADLITPFLHQRPAFADAVGHDSLKEGCSSHDVDAIQDFFSTGSMVSDESDMEKISSPVSSVLMKIENVHDDACKDGHAKDESLHLEKDVDAHVDVDADADADVADVDADAANVDADADLKYDKGKENGNGNDHKWDNEEGDDDVDDGDVHNDQNCHGIDAESDAGGEWQQRVERIMATESTRNPLQQRENVGAEMGARSSVEEGEGMMSTEELNERASAFISAFRKKLISTAIEDVSGQV